MYTSAHANVSNAASSNSSVRSRSHTAANAIIRVMPQPLTHTLMDLRSLLYTVVVPCTKTELFSSLGGWWWLVPDFLESTVRKHFLTPSYEQDLGICQYSLGKIST